MKIRLKDGAPRSPAEADVNVAKNGNTIEISTIEAQADAPPVVLEFYRGKLTLRVYTSTSPTQAVFELDLPYDASFGPAKAPAVAAGTTDDELAAFDAA